MCLQVHRFSCSHVEDKPILCRRYQGIQGTWNRIVGRLANTWREDCSELSRIVAYQTFPCRACRNLAATMEQMRAYREWMAPAGNARASTVTQTETQTQTSAPAGSSQAGSQHTREPEPKHVKPPHPTQQTQ